MLHLLGESGMSRISKLSAFIGRGFSSASVAARPSRATATRARRVPEGPGLAYFVNSYTPGDGDQPATTTTAQGEDDRFRSVHLSARNQDMLKQPECRNREADRRFIFGAAYTPRKSEATNYLELARYAA